MNSDYMQRPARRSPSARPAFRSRHLGRTITSADLLHLDDADLAAFRQEVENALAAVKRDIVRAKACPRIPNHQFAELEAQRIELGSLHQSILRFLKDTQKAAHKAAQADGGGGTDVAAYFQRVARQELDAVTYQRIVLQAEMRRAADHQRARTQVAA